ncbi:hypothetical protein BY458DRAFT_444504 [Sporodiniella umbellata]|nr:hypothetical protein BY458DRAFT_444504 [Sporodiniella umbellata]
MGDAKTISVELGNYICSLLFHYERGITRFLRNFALSRDGSIMSAQTNLLGFLTTFITKAKSVLQVYVTELEACCIQIASIASGRARVAALDVLITMLNKQTSQLDTSVMNIPSIYNRFSSMYTLPPSKVSPTIKAKLLELLGTLARFYPSQVKDPILLKTWCLNSLDHTVFKNPKESAFTPGALNCLNSVLCCKIRLIEPESDESDRLFQIILNLLRISSDLTRYTSTISALDLFSAHTSLFKNMILPHCEELYKYLQVGSTHHNRSLFKHATFAYDHFLIALADIIYINPHGLREKAALQVNFFTIDLPDANSEQHEYLRHLPSFLRAYSSFVGELDQVPNELMDALYRMCDTFIVNFARMSGHHRIQGVNSISDLILMLHRKGEGVLRKFLGSFFEKALIYTCTDIEIPGKGLRHVYQDLLYFWEVMLKRAFKQQLEPPILSYMNSTEDSDEEGDFVKDIVIEETMENTTALSRILYDTFMTSIIRAIDIFNLKLTDSEEGVSEDTNSKILTNTLQPVNPKDFLLFQNFVEFWCLLVKKLGNERLPDWIYILGTSLVDQSIKNPLVSGFYKMLAQILEVAKQRSFFEKCKKHHVDRDILFEGDGVKPDDYTTYLAFKEYVKEVWYRLQQFTDDLLVSCLKLVLAYPTAFFSISEISGPLEKALRIGIAYNPLAVIAVDTLDGFLSSSSDYEMDEDFLARVLPCINEYLLIGIVPSEDSYTHLNNLKKKSYKLPTASQRKFEAAPSESELGVAISEYTSIQELQLRMMRFLGRLGGKNKRMLMEENSHTKNEDIVAWDSTKRLIMHLPFQNATIDICLGKSAQQMKDTKESSESSYHKFYLRLFPIMLRLAIEPDQVPRDMFRLLNSQTIHWFTNNAQYENPETTALLKSCLHAACDSDASLREYGAECIQEFVRWSIKQTSRSTDGAQNIKSLLKRLYNLMSHPSSTQRLGSTLVFNRIYRLFREESTLVSEYTIELLGQLFLSLKLADSDHPSIGTKDQVVEAISHIKRIMRVKSNLFLKPSPTQRPFIGSEEVKDLPSVVEWSFQESAKYQRTYAKTCINFFAEFVTKVPGVASGKHWLWKKLDEDLYYLTNIFETGRLKPPSVLDEEEDQLPNYIAWIYQLQTTIDGYIWLIEREVVERMELLTQPSSTLLDAITYFVLNTPEEATGESFEGNTVEKTKIQFVYYYVSTRIVYFFGLLFSSTEKGFDCYQLINSETSDILLHPRFTQLVASILLTPKKISEKIENNQGHTVTNSSVNRIFNIAKQFIAISKEIAAQGLVEQVAESIAHVLLNENLSLAVDLNINRDQISLVSMVGTVSAIRFLQSSHLFGLVCQKAHQVNKNHPETVNCYCKTLLVNYLELCDQVNDPLWIQLLGETISIVLSQPEIAANEASNLMGLSGDRSKASDATKLSIIQKYGVYMFDSIAYNFSAFSMAFASNINYPIVADYLFIIFEYFKENRTSHRKPLKEMTDFVNFIASGKQNFLTTVFFSHSL